MSIVWVRKEVVLAIHEEQLAEHGGQPGIRDLNLLLSALDRPRNLADYATADLAELAAAYAYGIACNHPFIDGNKRTALVTAELFLALNAHTLTASDENCVRTFYALANNTLTQEDLASWFRRHCDM